MGYSAGFVLFPKAFLKRLFKSRWGHVLPCGAQSHVVGFGQGFVKSLAGAKYPFMGYFAGFVLFLHILPKFF